MMPTNHCCGNSRHEGHHDDQAKAGRAMQAMLKMKNLDFANLKKAHAGRPPS
jgi:hypothetical protein